MGDNPLAMHPRTMAAVKAHAAMHHAAMCSNAFANTLNASTTPVEIGLWDPASLVLCQEDYGYAVTAEGIAAPDAGEYKLFTSVYHESTSKHVQIAIEPSVNGVSLGHRMPGGWILGRKGITSAVCQLGGYRLTLSPGDVVSLQRVRLAKAGAVSAPAGRSYMTLERIK